MVTIGIPTLLAVVAGVLGVLLTMFAWSVNRITSSFDELAREVRTNHIQTEARLTALEVRYDLRKEAGVIRQTAPEAD